MHAMAKPSKIELWRSYEGITPAAPCYAVLLCSEDRRVLLRTDSEAPAVPVMEIPERQRVSPNLIAAVRKRFGLAAICRFEVSIADLVSGSRCVVLEVAEDERPASGEEWVEVREIEWDRIRPATARDVLWRALALATNYNTGRAPGNFVRPGWLGEVRLWAGSSVASRGLRLRESCEQYNMGPDFSLLRFNTTGQDVWFKAVNQANRREFDITRRLVELRLPHVASALAVHEGWRAWLMTDCGGTFLDAGSPPEHWESAARGLAELQVAAIGCAETLLDAGCPDLRVPALLDVIEPFLSRIATLMREQPKTPPRRLDSGDLRLIERWLGACCRELGGFAIPDTLGHADLNSGNILVGDDGPVFLDWMQGHVGHPFPSFEYLLRLSERLTRGRPEMASALRRQYVGPWRGVCCAREIERSLDLLPLVAPLAFAMSCLDWREGTREAPLLRSLARRVHVEAVRLDSYAKPEFPPPGLLRFTATGRAGGDLPISASDSSDAGNSAGKEVKAMNYSKPEIVAVGSAVEAIQSVLSKGEDPTDAAGIGDLTNPSAYEADE